MRVDEKSPKRVCNEIVAKPRESFERRYSVLASKNHGIFYLHVPSIGFQ
jgi:hypothetical protein